MLRLRKRLLWVFLTGIFAGGIFAALLQPLAVQAADPTPTPAAADPKAAEEQCQAESLTWIVCPLIHLTVKGVTYLEGKVAEQLSFTPLSQAADDPIKSVWGSFRNLANIFFILIFFVVIFGTSLGLNNYTVKKLLPRIIAAAILVQFSYLLIGIAVDIANVLGYGIDNIINSGIPKTCVTHGSGVLTGVGIAEGLAVFGAGGAAVIALGMIGPVLLMVVSGVLGLLAVFLTLELRLLIINFCIIIAPIMVALWVLPNTEKYFKMWREMLMKLLLMFPLIMLLFGAAKVLNIALAACGQTGNNDTWTMLMASLAPIIAFFIVPSTFKFAGKALNMGGSFFNGMAGNGQKGLGGLRKNMDESRREKGLMKYDKLRREGAPTTLAGKMNHRAAMMQAGFGGARGTNMKARKLEGATDSTTRAIADANALRESREKMGMMSHGDSMSAMQAVALDQQMDKRVAEAGMQTITYTNGDGKQVTGRLNEAVGAADDLKKLAKDSFKAEDYATGIAAMQTLGKNNGGRNALAELKLDPEVFGGTDKVKVNAALMGGRAATIYERGTAGVKGEAAPDVVKTPSSAFSGVSGAEFASMDPGTKQRYLKYAADQAAGGNDRIAKEANAAVGAALAAPTLRSKFGADDYAAVKGHTGGLDGQGSITPAEAAGDAKKTAALASQTQSIASNSAHMSDDVKLAIERGFRQSRGMDAHQNDPGTTTVVTAPAAAAPTLTAAAPTTAPAPANPNLGRTTMPSGGNNYQPNGPGGLYVPPPREVNPQAEGQDTDQTGTDRSVR